MSAVEPVVGVVALRTFRVSMNGHLVPATQYSNEWATGAAIARCSGFHQAPADDCSCGAYSMNDVHQLRTQYQQAADCSRSSRRKGKACRVRPR